MTEMPHTIGRDYPLRDALEKMQELKIRHLPVEDLGQLVGVLLESQVRLVLQTQDRTILTAQDAMDRAPYTVPPEAALGDVAWHMAHSKTDYAVIIKGQHVVGIFTATDGLRLLAEIFHASPKLVA